MKNNSHAILKQRVLYIGLVLISCIAIYYLFILCFFSFAFSDGNNLYDNIWLYWILPIMLLGELLYLVYFYRKWPWKYKYPLITFAFNVTIVAIYLLVTYIRFYYF